MERYYNNIGWSTMAIEMMERGEEDIENKLIGRDRDIQREIEEGKIRDSRYNRKYKEIEVKEGNLKYLEERDKGRNKDGLAIRALMKLRCGNLEEENKYWLKDSPPLPQSLYISSERICIFCGKGRDNIKHFIGECEIAREWFEKLGEGELERERKIWEDRLDEEKGEVLKKLWKEKVKRKKEKEKEKDKEVEIRHLLRL